MKKRLLSLLLVLTMLGTMLPFSALAEENPEESEMPSESAFSPKAEDNSAGQTATLFAVIDQGSCGKNVNYTLTDDGILTISGTGDMDDYSAGVEAAPPPWATQYKSIHLVNIKEGVTSIGSSAFCGCDNLDTVVIADTVTSIGESAFSSCTSLPSIIIPSHVETINSYAFSYCTELSYVFFAASDFYIAPYAFLGCSNLKDVYYQGPEAEWDKVFIGVYNEPVTDANTHYNCSCGKNVFWMLVDGRLNIFGSGKMTDYSAGGAGGGSVPPPWASATVRSVIISSGVTSIGNCAFYYCQELSDIVIANTVTSIGSDAFYSCSSLTSVSLPSNITAIGDEAFYGCTSLTSISFPTSLISIGYYAFSGCNRLKTVTIPANVNTLAGNAFCNCSSLTTISVNSSNYNYSSSDGVLYNKDKTILLCCPCGKSGSFSIAISVKYIMSDAFYNCTKLTSVNIPKSIATIGADAFQSCSKLTDVYYYGSETDWKAITIGSGNDKLKNATIHYNSNTCGTNVYWILADGMLTIYGSGAMKDYSSTDAAPWYSVADSIRYVVIKSGISAIGENAFSGCSHLEDVLYEGTESDWNYINIGSNNAPLLTAARHYNCTCGTDVYWFLRNGVLTILGSGAMEQYSKTDTAPWYSEADSIQSVIIEAGVTSIGNYAFYNCKSITSVTIPDSVTAICNYAFYQCDKLTSVSISANVTGIGMCAFSSCGALTSINVYRSNANFSSADGVLYNKDKTELLCCPGGKSGAFTVPAGITAIGKYAFYGCLKLSSVILPSGAEKIDSGAFSSCGLTTVFLPKSISTIVSSAFYGCKALTDVYYGGSETDWSSISIGSSNTPLKNAAIHYSSTCGTNVYWFLADGVLTIFGSGAMKDYTTTSAAPWASQAESIQSVVIQSGVKSIGDRAFYSCSNLSEVSLPSGVESIGTYAFSNCSSLTTITIPASVTSIHTNPFTGCTSLTAINVNSSNPNYSSVDGVLYNKDKTELIACPSDKAGVFIVPSGVTAIDSGAFYGCKKLTSVLLPAGLEKIYNYAFYNCTDLTTIELPQSTATVFKNAFTNCTKLRDVYYPGTEAEWNAINFDNANTLLTGADRHYCPVGDINNDGKLTLKDASLLFQWWNGKSISSGYLSRTALCNANGDSSTDLRDITLIYALIK